MEAIILIGIQATGKSTFYKAAFADTHVRINGDMLQNNRSCIEDLMDVCLRHGQPFCIDRMNFSRQQRQPFLERAKAAGFLRIGYYFRSAVGEALERNRNPDRADKGIPDEALHGIAAQLELPTYREGFDRLHHVTIDPERGFHVTDWSNDR